MAKEKWIYYLQVRGEAVAKVNTDAFEVAMVDMGFTRCSYAEYLQKRKLIRKREQQINIEGMKEWQQTDIQQ